jgi:hypothetical protein
MTKYKTRKNIKLSQKKLMSRRKRGGRRKTKRKGSKKRGRRKTKSKHYKGGYKPPPMNLKFSSEQQIQDHTLSQQQARGDYNAANNKMIGGKKMRISRKMYGGSQDIAIPSPPGISEEGQNNINKLIEAGAVEESLSKYDKVGGTRKKYKKKSMRRRRRRRKRSGSGRKKK